jgi:hypothetical protein
MNHPAELALTSLIRRLENGDVTISDDTKEQVYKEVKVALDREFSGADRAKRGFTLRMSNIGRPYCQLWFQKNKPEVAREPESGFAIKMMIGDIVEAAFKGFLKEAGVEYTDTKKVVWITSSGKEIVGHYDLEMNGAVDDVKSASPYAFDRKFESFETLAADDSFGYVAQLAAYARGSGLKVGGWWVINKTTGQFKYTPADGMDVDAVLADIEAKIAELDANEFRRCFEPVEETFRSKLTGNTKLSSSCGFCDFKDSCWDIIRAPETNSTARNPKEVEYIYIAPENMVTNS